MICLDCNKPIRANAKRCTLCSARHYMEARVHKMRKVHELRTCVNEACKCQFVPARDNQTHCSKACKNRKAARQSFRRLGEDGLAARAEANRRYRARLKVAQEAARAKRLQERIDRINAKARAAA
jgi:hypothetical protein